MIVSRYSKPRQLKISLPSYISLFRSGAECLYGYILSMNVIVTFMDSPNG